MARNRVSGGIGLILIAVLFILVNLIATIGLRGYRLDLTQNRLYTLSSGARSVLAHLNEPVFFKVYYSTSLANQFPTVKAFEGRVADLLDAFKRASNGHLKVEYIDPQPYTAAEDRATAAGIQGNSTPNGNNFYFGLVATGPLNGRDVMPVITPQREPFLEYNFAHMIVGLTRPNKPKVEIITGLPLETGPGGAMAAMRGQSHPYAVYQQLAKTYDVNVLPNDFKVIPADTKVLVIAQPRPLNDQQYYALDQYLMAGGKAVALVDPYSEQSAHAPRQSRGIMGPVSSNLDRLFKPWGIEIDPTKIVADRLLATPVMLPGSNRSTDYVVWLRANKGALNQGDVVTAGLHDVEFASTGAITLDKDAKVKLRPLVSSSTDAELLATKLVKATRQPDDLLIGFTPTGKHYVIAGRIMGDNVPSVFKGVPPKPAKPGDAPTPTLKGKEPGFGSLERKPLKKTVGTLDMIVIADADLLNDRMWVDRTPAGLIPRADNGNFILNAVENLTGSNQLINLRSRNVASRPFDVLVAMRRAADDKFLQRRTELQATLASTEAKIQDLRSKRSTGSAGLIIDKQAQQAIAGLNAKIVSTRTALRQVQRNLNVDINALQNRLRLLNIIAMPVLVGLIALALAFIRQRGRIRRAAR